MRTLQAARTRSSLPWLAQSLKSWSRGASATAMVLLLLVELTYLSIRYDSQALDLAGLPSLGKLLQLAGWGVRLGLAASLGVVLFRLARTEAGSEPPATVSTGSRRTSLASRVGLHLASFAAFAWLTGLVFEPSTNTRPAALVAVWFLSAVGLIATWSWIAWPSRQWIVGIRGLALPVGFGLAIGAGSIVLAIGTRELWAPFHRATFELSVALLGLIHPATHSDPDRMILGAGTFSVAISPQCSGYEGIGLVWAFLVAYLVLFRRALQFPAALVVLPIGTVCIWLANVVRIVVLVSIGAWGWPEVAVGGFHSHAGWLAFLAVAFGLVLATRSSPLLAASPVALRGGEGSNPTAAFLAPLLVIIGLGLVAGALSASSTEGSYPLRVVATLAALLWFRRDYAGIGLAPRWSWPAVVTGLLGFALWMLLEPGTFTGSRPSSRVPAPLASGLSAWGVTWLAFRIFGSVVTVPLAEELAFRGFLTRRLISDSFWSVPPGTFRWSAFLISSVLFGALHDRWVAGTVAGMLYALVWYRRGSLWEAVLAHGLTNLLLAAWVLGTGDWNLWS